MNAIGVETWSGRDAHRDARDELARALADLAGRDVLGIVSVAAPQAPVEALLESGADSALLWAAPGAHAFSGAGSALVLTASGPGRFRRIRDQAAALRVVRLGQPGDPRPRWFGGFAFQAESSAGPWESFGEARFCLPRWRFTRDAGRAWLALAVHGRELEDTDDRDRWLEEFARQWRVLSSPRKPSASHSPALVSVDHGARDAYESLVRAIVDGIRAGRFEKVVAARRAVLELEPPPDPRTLLSRLSEQAPACTRFAFRVGARTFLGATPERLIDQNGLAIETEALAGSIRAGSPSQATLLSSSGKDLGEHQLVVREIVSALSPVCSRLDHPSTPEIRALKHVLHLHTPIRGQLAAPRHVLELVERLHPTPAVGGVPAAEARRWIAEREAEPRGWYAGPVGWFDAEGNGQFAVALRSGLFEGSRAHLYAGAGIVRDSDPASEYAETALKLEALLSALGVEA